MRTAAFVMMTFLPATFVSMSFRASLSSGHYPVDASERRSWHELFQLHAWQWDEPSDMDGIGGDMGLLGICYSSDDCDNRFMVRLGRGWAKFEKFNLMRIPWHNG